MVLLVAPLHELWLDYYSTERATTIRIKPQLKRIKKKAYNTKSARALACHLSFNPPHREKLTDSETRPVSFHWGVVKG